MSKKRIFFMADRLTVYAMERQARMEQPQPEGAPPWSEQRRFWTDAILQGMAKLDGLPHDPSFMEQFDQRLAAALGRSAVEALPPKEQVLLIRDLGRYVSALEATGDDRRRQIAVVGDLLGDMVTHRSWGLTDNGLACAREQVESALLRMTAQMPIRFTRVLLGGDRGPCESGFVSGAVTDAESICATELYGRMSRQHLEVTEWSSICTVYVGRVLPSARGAADASAFDLEIINRAGDRFLAQQGVYRVGGPYRVTVSPVPTMVRPEESQIQMEPTM